MSTLYCHIPNYPKKICGFKQQSLYVTCHISVGQEFKQGTPGMAYQQRPQLEAWRLEAEIGLKPCSFTCLLVDADCWRRASWNTHVWLLVWPGPPPNMAARIKGQASQERDPVKTSCLLWTSPGNHTASLWPHSIGWWSLWRSAKIPPKRRELDAPPPGPVKKSTVGILCSLTYWCHHL